MLLVGADTCLKCGGCIPLCPTDALLLLKSGLTCDQNACIDCGDCVQFCPVEALEMDHG